MKVIPALIGLDVFAVSEREAIVSETAQHKKEISCKFPASFLNETAARNLYEEGQHFLLRSQLSIS